MRSTKAKERAKVSNATTVDSSVTLRPTVGVEKARAKETQRMGDASPMGNTPRVKASERATLPKEEKARDQTAKVAMFPSAIGSVTSVGKRVTSPSTAQAEERMKLNKDDQ